MSPAYPPHQIFLDSDPVTPLSVTLIPGSPSAPLVVFMTGLARPASSFEAAVDQIISMNKSSEHQPSILTWDRYGQGLSGKQTKTHNAMQVVQTLRELLEHVLQGKVDEKKLILVGNSIGCPLARLYATKYAGVHAILFLDSMIAHSDFVSILDPPSSEHVDQDELDALAKGREITAKIFHPSVPNAEGFDRLHIGKDVPYSDKPALPGSPWVTVVGHDPLFFAEDTEQKMGIPAKLVDKYLNAEWSRYNHGLAKITAPAKSKGPIIAKGADHFIQINRPDLVAEEVHDLLQKVVNEA